MYSYVRFGFLATFPNISEDIQAAAPAMSTYLTESEAQFDATGLWLTSVGLSLTHVSTVVPHVLCSLP